MNCTQINPTNTCFNEPSFNQETKLTANYFTQVKIQRYALYTLAAIATITGAGLIGVSVAGIITWPLAFLAIPLFISAFALVRLGLNMKDFEDPTEVANLRMEAFHLNLSGLREEYAGYGGLSGVIGHRILSVTELRKKLQQELGAVFSISEFSNKFKSYHISEYTRLELLTSKEASSLESVRYKYYTLNDDRSRQYDKLDMKYPDRLDRKLSDLQEEESRAHCEFNQQQQNVQNLGDTLTYGATFGMNHDPKNHGSHFRTLIAGTVLTDLATIGVGMARQSALNDKLRYIEQLRKAVRSDPIILNLQTQYNDEASQLNTAYSKDLEKITVEFRAAKDKITQFDFVPF